MMLAKATSTLASSWHNVPSYSPISTQNRITFQNLTNETVNDLNFNKPDFSDFKDPWDNYLPHLDPFLQIPQQVTQEISKDSGQLLQRPDNVNKIDNHIFNEHIENNQEEYNRSQEICQGNNYQENYQHNNYQENNYKQNNCQDNYYQQNNYQDNHYQQNNYQESSCQSTTNYYHSSHQQPSSSEEYHSSQKLSSHLEELCWQHQEVQTHQENKISSEFHNHHHHHQFQEQRQSCNDESFVESQKNMSREIFETGEKLALKDNLKIDEQTDNHTISSHPLNIRVIPKKVASQSELCKIEEHLESKDTGLAGALAQLTLGEARSNEQVAFEEHMRKQSWEQGQIDYLGRDSFDNIWKKISETLASHPEREISPPLDQLEMKKDIAESPVIVKSEEEEEEVEKPATNETTDQKEPSAISAPITTDIQGSVTVVVSQIIEEPVAEKEKDSGSTILEQVQQIPISQDIPVSEAISVAESVSQSSSLPTAIPVVPLLETSIIPSEVPESVVISEQQLGEFAIPQETISKESAVCQIPNLQPILPPETSTLQESQIQETSVQEKPVPIQVAESVLQAEPKESVSQVTSPVGEEAISSIVSVVQESALAISEALISPPTSDVAPKLENGCADHSTEILTPQIPAAIVPPEPLLTQAEVPIQHEIKEADGKKEEEEVVVVSQTKEATETKEKSESKSVTQQEEKKETEPSEAKESQEVAKPKETKLERRKSSSMEKPLLPSCEPKLTVQIPQSKPSEISGLVQKPRDERKKSLSSSSSTEKSSETETQQERRPMRSKEMKVPPTPTVTEATPPTSPPINPELVEGGTKVTTKKIVKKIVKKQSTEESEDAAEGPESSTGKKVTKKVVKKVVKKKESSEGGEGSTEKGKKIVKKGTQLETDKSVPETPPPASSEAPVPPKRKVKSSTTTITKGTTSKKSDTEL